MLASISTDTSVMSDISFDTPPLDKETAVRAQQQTEQGDEGNISSPTNSNASSGNKEPPPPSSPSSGRDVDKMTYTRKPQGGDNNNDPTMSLNDMLLFVLPCLAIYLATPFLSNTDNIFVGRTVGTEALGALSPATLSIDQLLYLCTFLGKATTNLVARAYAFCEAGQQGNTKAARDAGSPPTTAGLALGLLITIFYVFGTPLLMKLLDVPPELQQDASDYIHIRGSVFWVALVQTIFISIFLAVRDAVTPSLVIAVAVIIDILVHLLLCLWPVRGGLVGAASATTITTVASCAMLVGLLVYKGLCPRFRIPTTTELAALLEFVGPVMINTFLHILALVYILRFVRDWGVDSLAAYQVSLNVMMFFGAFGDPICQLGQSFLPPLIDSTTLKQKHVVIRERLASILWLGMWTALASGGAAGLLIEFCASLFTSDSVVQNMVRETALEVFLAVAALNLAVSVEGALLASRDLFFLIFQTVVTLLLQWYLLQSPWCTTVAAIMSTFVYRLVAQAMLGYIRIVLGYGEIGKALHPPFRTSTTATATAASSAKEEKEEAPSTHAVACSTTNI